jgi:hypothetical protein
MYRKKSFAKTILYVVLALALSLGSLAMIGRMTDGFTNFTGEEIRIRNPNNLIPASYPLFESGLQDNCVSIVANDDGSITLDGTPLTTKAFALCEVTLQPGIYTLTASADGKYHGGSAFLTIEGKQYFSDVVGVSTFEITETQVCTLSVKVRENWTLNNITLYPTLVRGTEAGAFFQ